MYVWRNAFRRNDSSCVHFVKAAVEDECVDGGALLCLCIARKLQPHLVEGVVQ